MEFPIHESYISTSTCKFTWTQYSYVGKIQSIPGCMKLCTGEVQRTGHSYKCTSILYYVQSYRQDDKCTRIVQCTRTIKSKVNKISCKMWRLPLAFFYSLNLSTCQSSCHFRHVLISTRHLIPHFSRFLGM